MVSFNTNLKSLNAAVKKMDAAAGMGQRYCPYCRLNFRHHLPNPNSSPGSSKDMLVVECEFCHSKAIVDITRANKDARKILKLMFTSTIEEHYTNPKVNAFNLWLEFQSEETENPQQSQPPASATARRKGKTRKCGRSSLLNKWQGELEELIEKKHRRFRSIYGARPFPEHVRRLHPIWIEAETKNDERPYVDGILELGHAWANQLFCAELEKIIWGGTRPQTQSEIEKLERRMDELVKTEEDAMKEKIRRYADKE